MYYMLISVLYKAKFHFSAAVLVGGIFSVFLSSIAVFILFSKKKLSPCTKFNISRFFSFHTEVRLCGFQTNYVQIFAWFTRKIKFLNGFRSICNKKNLLSDRLKGEALNWQLISQRACTQTIRSEWCNLFISNQI